MEKISANKRINISNQLNKNNAKFSNKQNAENISKNEKKNFRKNKFNKEKLKHKQSDKNKKFKENLQKTLKNSPILCKIYKNWLNFLVLFALLIIVSVLFFCVFSKSEYYNFLAKPKVLANSNLLILIVTIFCILIFAYYFFKLVLETNLCKNIKTISESDNKKDINNFTQKNDNVSHIINDKNKVKNIIDLNDKNLFCKLKNLFYKLKNKKINFPISYVCIFALLCFIALFFSLKNLVLCVILSFFVLVLTTCIFASSKKLWQKFFCITNVLVSICIFLSFYFMFLLN